MAGISGYDGIGQKPNLIGLDCKAITNIFKKIKRKGILSNKVYYYKDEIPSKSLLESNDFMDNIKYYRLLNKISKRKMSLDLGIDDESYSQYELKAYEIQNFMIAEKMIEALNLKDVIELPDYFKIMKKYSIEDIRDIIVNYANKKEFSEETGIARSTINYWFQKNAPKSLSTCTYKKMVNFFNKHNIAY